MAEKLKDYDFSRNGTGRKSKYPWEEWFDGSIWRIEQGKDFDPTVAGMYSTVFGAAKRRGLIVTVKKEDTAVVFQALKES